MNPFMVASSVLMFAASAWAIQGGEWKTAGIYAAYAVANAILATVKA